MKKMLIVDDEIDIREFAKSFFSKRGIDVTTISDGEQAVELVFDLKPDLLLLDVHMEGISGIEVLKRLRARGSDVTVIMVTGVEDECVITQAKELGASNYIHKPLILEELEKIVSEQLWLNQSK